MFIEMRDMEEFGLRHFNAATAATGAAAKALQSVSDEAIGFCEKRFETGCAWGEKLARARKLEDLIELQSLFARAAYEDCVAQARKLSDLCLDLASQTLKQSTLAAAPGTIGRPAAKTPARRTAGGRG